MSNTRSRLASIDVVRGIAMILMALDHVRDFVGDRAISPTNLTAASTALFLTRWITHLCAPTFFLLTGTGAYLAGRGRPAREVSWFLLTRGVWLLALEIVVLRALAWQFNLDYRLTLLNVLWALGWAMIALSALVYLPPRIIGAVAVALIAGHNLFDGIRSAHPLWTVLHSPNVVLQTPRHTIFIAYPLIPWIGVTALGYVLGRVYDWPVDRRRSWLVRAGAASIALFVLLRAVNVYGDPARWRTLGTPLRTMLSFMNTTKYPPSLLFLLMTLGPALLLLALAEGGTGRMGRRGWTGGTGGTGGIEVARTIGQVPLFYFALHAFLIHVVAIAICYAEYGAIHWMFESPTLADFPMTAPPGWGVPLWAVYVIWIAVVAALYPLCAWFAGVKQRRREWWLRYL